MKKLLVIIFLFCAAFAGAQKISAKKVDKKTGDTIQMTHEKMLYDPEVKNLLLAQSYKVGWRIEKLLARGHTADTLLLYLDLAGGNFISHTKPSPLFITFADGHTISLPLRTSITNIYTGLPTYSREGDGTDTYATYILSPDAIHQLLKGQIKEIKVTYISGTKAYPVNTRSAVNIPKYLSCFVE